ncbi:MAG TPA: hypothetical protein VLI05_03315 [Candidatus Saccharimonadia bacterium]|nr:hypothetical protein [Candidatus Saccharimonadia bacterium]
MAKKNKSTKKHRFKYTEPAGLAGEAASAGTVAATSKLAATAPVASGRDFSYVSVDLRRLAILAISLVVVEAVLWALLAYTAIGSTVYSWFGF